MRMLIDNEGGLLGEGSAEPPFRCDTCSKTFPTKTKYNGHIRVHSKSKYKCQDCGKVRAWFGLIWPFMVVYLIRVFLFQEFSGPSPLKYHRWIHEGKGVRNFGCQFEGCGKRWWNILQSFF